MNDVTVHQPDMMEVAELEKQSIDTLSSLAFRIQDYIDHHNYGADIMLGRILMAARHKLPQNQEYGAWLGSRFPEASQQRASELVRIATYFDEPQLRKLGKSKAAVLASDTVPEEYRQAVLAQPKEYTTKAIKTAVAKRRKQLKANTTVHRTPVDSTPVDPLVEIHREEKPEPVIEVMPIELVEKIMLISADEIDRLRSKLIAIGINPDQGTPPPTRPTLNTEDLLK